MKKCNLSIRTRTTISQQLPKDYEKKLAIFRTYCKNKIAEKKIRPEHITNMGEVPLTFDIPVKRTVEKTGTSTVSIYTAGTKKSSLTVILARNYHPWSFSRGRLCQKKGFRPASSSRLTHRAGWTRRR